MGNCCAFDSFWPSTDDSIINGDRPSTGISTLCRSAEYGNLQCLVVLFVDKALGIDQRCCHKALTLGLVFFFGINSRQ